MSDEIACECKYKHYESYGGGRELVSKCVRCQLTDLNKDAERLRSQLAAVELKIAVLKPRSTYSGRAVVELQEAEVRLARALQTASKCGLPVNSLSAES